jgi:hypothetical protein
MLTVAALYLSLIAAPQACPGSFAVDARSMGPLSLGQPVSSIVANFKAVEDHQYGSARYVITLCGNTEIVAAAGKSGGVQVLSTTSPLFLTNKGAHVGMTMAELRRLYPAGKLNTGIGEGLVATFDTRTGVVFDLEEELVSHGCYDPGADCEPQIQAVKAVAVYIRTP